MVLPAAVDSSLPPTTTYFSIELVVAQSCLSSLAVTSRPFLLHFRWLHGVDTDSLQVPPRAVSHIAIIA